jgi:L-lactate utilization protein LutC
MLTSRDRFLQRVRQAVTAGNRSGSAVPLEPRGTVGYQGSGPDPVTRFRDELTAAGGCCHVVPDREAAVAKVLELVQSKSARGVLVGRGPFVDSLDSPARLGTLEVEVTAVDTLAFDTSLEPFFAADIGISGVDYLIAETGSVALLAQPGEPRSLSLLPPVHIAVADSTQLLPDLFDLFERLPSEEGTPVLPSCLTLITGPSKTGDIELRLVTGVHGPGEIHVVLVRPATP